MAEKNDNWFGSWLNAAKNKSSEVFEFVKKDLEEFGSAVKNEASNVVSTTGTVFERTFKLDSPDSTASTMKKSFSSFLGQMNTVLNPSPDDSDTEAILIMEDSETVTLTKQQRAIYELQKNDDTFLKDPQGEDVLKKYNCWLEIIEDQLSEERIKKHLSSSIVLKNQYTKLVPDKVSPHLFWERYLFKKALLEDDIAYKEAIEKRELKEKQITEDSVKWEQEDFSRGFELTEEEQIKLLEQYEKETKQRTKEKENSPKRVAKSLIGEEILFQKNVVSDNTAKNTSKVNKLDSYNSLDSSSNSSTDIDGDWEKISDVEK